MSAKHPMQPVVWVKDVIRFKGNPIVSYLLEHGGIDLNQVAIAIAQGQLKATKADQSHFAQMIGYSVSGWGDLSYVSPKDVREADGQADALITARENKKP